MKQLYWGLIAGALSARAVAGSLPSRLGTPWWCKGVGLASRVSGQKMTSPVAGRVIRRLATLNWTDGRTSEVVASEWLTLKALYVSSRPTD